MAEPEAVSPSESAAPPPEEDLSLSDHEARYSESARSAQAEPATPPAELPAAEPSNAGEGTPETEDAAGPRDEKGRFLPKPKTRHRAESAIAGPADVPRIQQLSARLRAAEAERDALKARIGGTTVAPEVST